MDRSADTPKANINPQAVQARQVRQPSGPQGSMPSKSPRDPLKKKKILSTTLLIIGVITLVVGVVFLVLNLIKMNRAADGDYLVSAGNWVLDGSDSVIWDFTEVGKGTLTTNNHLNDYIFIWAIKDDKLKIETDWLYDLENEYTYQLDQGAKTLTLTADGTTYRFTAR